MANDEKPQIRVRINIGRTASGSVTWDATVELERPMWDWVKSFDLPEDLQRVSDTVLRESNRVQQALNSRYPQDEV
jgi:hypothetical protein